MYRDLPSYDVQYCPEFELTFITEGSGNRFVGQHISRFEPGDIVLLGSNLPHCWKSDPTVPGKNSGSIVVHFLKGCLGEDFWLRPEMSAVYRLLQQSVAGVQFTGKTNEIGKMMFAILEAKDRFDRLLLFLQTLHFLASQTTYVILETNFQAPHPSSSDEKRLTAVWSYMTEHFTENIQLEKAASIARLTTAAFCKYFKRTTRKTFMGVVVDWRVEYARNLLASTDRPVSDICFESGFRDLSNFHRAFRLKHNCTPLKYRKLYSNLDGEDLQN